MARPVWSRRGTAPGRKQPARYFVVTHPFHPWRGRRFELLDLQRQWGQWRVYYLTGAGHRACFLASWTDVGPKDPFVEQAHGRTIARVEDLLELAKMVAAGVKEIKPIM